mmetsp:Transcript_25922/g.38297  ORF Transcript_25922/g.38297 Transcript_25922/m.38297 type:complete len:146 (-) Transcript_25922:307-744(-)
MSCCGIIVPQLFSAKEKNETLFQPDDRIKDPKLAKIVDEKEKSNRLLRYKLSKERPWGISRAELLDAELIDPSFSLQLEPSISECSTLSMGSCGSNHWVDWRFNEKLSPLRHGSDDFSFRQPVKQFQEEPESTILCLDFSLIDSD